jgi:hypothetical protein
MIEKEKPKMTQEEIDRLMEDFLKKGGVVEKLPLGVAKQIGSLEKHRKPQYSEYEIKKKSRDSE